MKPPSLRLAAAASAAALVATLVAAAPAAAHREHHRGIDWEPCPELEAGQEVDCATIEVPLDYRRPWGEKIEIGLARRQAGDTDRRIGTILMDPGGPGGSGVATVRQGNPLSPEAAERFDIVGFDPRGINTSTHVECGEDALTAVFSIGVPTDHRSFEALEEANADLTADCRERTGRLFDHVDNRHTVLDMERIRRALGEGRLNYLGYSYGTLMGQQYAEVYPWHIRTMVLDGNMDHSIGSTWEFMSAETAAFERNFLDFAAWCDGEPDCALHDDGVQAVYGELKAAARAGELDFPGTDEAMGFYDLSVMAFDANFPQYWPDLAEFLVALRDGEPYPGPLRFAESGVEYPAYPMWCQDWGFDIADFGEFEQLTGRLSQTYPNVEWTPYNEYALQCVGSGIEHTNPRDELDVDWAPPLVFIGNEHDYATVYDWTLTAARQADGHLITYEGYWHTAYSGVSDCVDEAVDAYFIDRRIPKEGLSCPNQDFPGPSPLSERRGPALPGPF
ncbi:alpha/beta hydrolase [Glycomyces halotolerans]